MGASKAQEKELLESVDLCNSKGLLNRNCIGWARKPIINCNLTGHKYRKKKWNYWLILNDDCLFSATISNMDYLGMVFIYFYNYKTGEFVEKTVASPFGKGCIMLEGINDSLEYINSKMRVSFKGEVENTKMRVDCSEFGKGTISVDLMIKRPENYESINVVIPWSKRKFQFTSKQNCIPVEGKIIYNGETFELHKENSFASLDFGRGVWPYNTKWNWVTCSGSFNNRIIGFNLGGTWTDGTGMTENGFVIDGTVNKLSENIIFEYDKENMMEPWHIKSKDTDRADIKFQPIYKRLAETNAYILKSKVYQILGEFTGDLITDNGEKVHFEKLKGSAEEHIARW